MDNPETVVDQLINRHNLNEPQIVKRLRKLGVKTSQPTINRIKNGKARRTTFELAQGLNRLKDELIAKARP